MSEKPPRFFIQQVTEHCWQLQERQKKRLNFGQGPEWYYSVPFPSAANSRSRDEALAWIRWIVTGPDEEARKHLRQVSEPLIMGPVEEFDEMGKPLS